MRLALRAAGADGFCPKILRLSEDLPIVVEIVDAPEKIEAFLPVLDEMMAEGMVTLERVKVITYRHHAGEESQSARKLRSRSSPAPVSTLSGWNCTPCTASSRCRTPMTTRGMAG